MRRQFGDENHSRATPINQSARPIAIDRSRKLLNCTITANPCGLAPGAPRVELLAGAHGSERTVAVGAQGRRSVGRDHDLAEGQALADVPQRFRHLLEPEPAVDVDADVARDGEVG